MANPFLENGISRTRLPMAPECNNERRPAGLSDPSGRRTAFDDMNICLQLERLMPQAGSMGKKGFISSNFSVKAAYRVTKSPDSRAALAGRDSSLSLSM